MTALALVLSVIALGMYTVLPRIKRHHHSIKLHGVALDKLTAAVIDLQDAVQELNPGRTIAEVKKGNLWTVADWLGAYNGFTTIDPTLWEAKLERPVDVELLSAQAAKLLSLPADTIEEFLDGEDAKADLIAKTYLITELHSMLNIVFHAGAVHATTYGKCTRCDGANVILVERKHVPCPECNSNVY